MRQILIGADGGGTKTTLLAVDATTGRTVATATGGSIHALSLGTAVALQNLRDTLAALTLSVEDHILALSIGDPAIDDGDPHAGDAFCQAIRASDMLPADTVLLSKSDAFMALYGFTLGGSGALLIAGTGSMGIAMDESGNVSTIGGWCEPTTDPGSGHFIGVEGIKAALSAFDGIAPATLLTDKLLAFFACSTPRDLIGHLNSPDVTRTRLASFSREVAEAASAGDAVSCEILQRAGQVLARYGIALLDRIAPAKNLGVYGSVLIKNAQVRHIFEENVRITHPDAVVSVPKFPPEYGAVRYAADMLKTNTIWEE